MEFWIKKRNKITVKERYFRSQTWVCQNVSDEVLLAWFKFHAKIQRYSRVWERETERQRDRETERDRERQRQRQRETKRQTDRQTEIYDPPSPLSKDEGVKDIEHSMSIKNLILGVNSVMVSYCLHQEGEGVSEKASKGKHWEGVVNSECSHFKRRRRITVAITW